MIIINGVRLMDPTLSDGRERHALAPRLDTLDGVALGLLANGKTHGDRLMDLVVEELATRYELGPVLRVTKSHPSAPPTEGEIGMVAEHSLAVLSAIGD